MNLALRSNFNVSFYFKNNFSLYKIIFQMQQPALPPKDSSPPPPLPPRREPSASPNAIIHHHLMHGGGGGGGGGGGTHHHLHHPHHHHHQPPPPLPPVFSSGTLPRLNPTHTSQLHIRRHSTLHPHVPARQMAHTNGAGAGASVG